MFNNINLFAKIKSQLRFFDFFSDRDLLIRTNGIVKHIRLSRFLQLNMFAGVIGLFVWVVYSSLSFLLHNNIVVSAKKELIEARVAYRGLLSEVTDYQVKFSRLASDLGKNHGLMLGLVEKNASLQQNVQTVKNKLVTSQSRQQEITRARLALKNKLSDIQGKLNLMNNHNFALKGNLNTISSDLEDAILERNKAWKKNDNYKIMVSKLEKKMRKLNYERLEVYDDLNRKTQDDIKDITNVLDLAGFDTKKIISLSDLRPSQKVGLGGPYIPTLSPANFKQDLKAKIAFLNTNLNYYNKLLDLMNHIPISPPLDYFTISSHFGKRRDPINKRWAMHNGLDMVGTRNTKIYSTGPGKVTFAGRKGRYGKLVEVDHGFGFKTRYGHLNKIFVKRGQKIKYRKKVGLMGTTGRSTGNHLHYEILLDGKNYNPWRIIKAGRYVYKKQ
ncbi:MAG: M23 family metallopeptidase [Rhodospirillaceae bacterium]|nr:M23 family metallopeptidase [Rhodospirillaceae bacterium]